MHGAALDTGLRKKKDKGIDNYYLCAQAKRQELSGVQVQLSLKRGEYKMLFPLFYQLGEYFK